MNKRILMLLDREFPPDPRVENEINSLVNAGYDLHIACYTRLGKPTYEKYKNYTIYRKSISNFLYKSSVACLKLPFYFWFWRIFINALFKKYQYQVIHVHDLPLAKIGVIMKKKYKAWFNMDLHENWPAFLRSSTHTKTLLGKVLSSDKQWIKYEKKMAVQADSIIVVIDEAKERLINLNIQTGKIHIVSNLLNLDQFDITYKPSTHESIILFYAGGITKHRGLQTIIKSMAQLISKYKDLELWILGHGSYKNELEELIRNLGIENHIKFLGHKSFAEMMKLLQESDIALIPHLKSDHTDSTIPNKLFQYLYTNKIIVATNCTPIERILYELKSGYIYKSEDIESSTKALEAAIKDKIQNIPMHTKNKVLEKYTWKNAENNLLNLYKTILN